MMPAAQTALGLILVSVLTSLVVYSGVDRLAMSGSVADGLVIVPMGPQRLRNAGTRALAAGDFADATHYARQAIARDPANPASTSLLGAIQLRVGDPAASQTYLAAGRFGWRDVGTQIYLIGQADAAANVRVMAERTDALLRIGVPFNTLAPIVRRVEKLPGGPSALATRLSRTPTWSGDFVIEATKEPDDVLTLRITTLQVARDQGFVVDCEKVDDAVGSLLNQNRPSIAYAFWQKMGCGGSGPVNFDRIVGDFAEVARVNQSRPTHFGWSLLSGATIDAKVDSTSAGSALYVSSNSTIPTHFAKRMILLPPGRYRMRWTTRQPPGEPALGISVDVICLNNGMTVTGPVRSAEQVKSGDVELAVPSKQCPAQQLRFVAQSTVSAPQRAWISGITIAPISPTGER